MKAIGSNKKQIKRMISAESIFIAFMSWLLTAVIGVPIEYVGSIIMGNIVIDTPLTINLASFIIPNLIWLRPKRVYV
ncbi:FtsX-like permease family protein [Paenibacillus sp. GSMTC-2017]|nr:FtsX-like permease family protein [Paenibacillus sp. GSMTC-2017]